MDIFAEIFGWCVFLLLVSAFFPDFMVILIENLKEVWNAIVGDK